jgi:hydroxymethylbilane synthase
MVHLRIGCRPSRLAVTQTEQSAAYLCARSPGTTFELVKIETSGDRTKGDLKPFGGKGLFSQEIEAALGRGDVNLVIHCLKDLPGDKPPTEGLEFAGYLPREDAADVLITRGDVGLADLPQGATVGSSSPRRLAQLRAARPDFTLQTVFRHPPRQGERQGGGRNVARRRRSQSPRHEGRTASRSVGIPAGAGPGHAGVAASGGG